MTEAVVLSWMGKPYSEPLSPEDCSLWLRYLAAQIQALEGELKAASDLLVIEKTGYKSELRKAILRVQLTDEDGRKLTGPERIMRAESQCEDSEIRLALCESEVEAIKVRFKLLDRVSSNVQSILSSLRDERGSKWQR